MSQKQEKKGEINNVGSVKVPAIYGQLQLSSLTLNQVSIKIKEIPHYLPHNTYY